MLYEISVKLYNLKLSDIHSLHYLVTSNMYCAGKIDVNPFYPLLGQSLYLPLHEA